MPLSTTSAKVAPRRKRIQATVDAGTKVASTCVRHAAHTTPPSRKDTYTSPATSADATGPPHAAQESRLGRSPEKARVFSRCAAHTEGAWRASRPAHAGERRLGCRRRARAFQARPASRGRAARPWARAAAACSRSRRTRSLLSSKARLAHDVEGAALRAQHVHHGIQLQAGGERARRLAGALRHGAHLRAVLGEEASAPGRSPPASSCAAPGRGPCTSGEATACASGLLDARRGGRDAVLVVPRDGAGHGLASRRRASASPKNRWSLGLHRRARKRNSWWCRRRRTPRPVVSGSTS